MIIVLEYTSTKLVYLFLFILSFSSIILYNHILFRRQHALLTNSLNLLIKLRFLYCSSCDIFNIPTLELTWFPGILLVALSPKASTPSISLGVSYARRPLTIME